MSEWHPDSPTYEEFENPIYRYRVLQEKDPEVLSEIREEFARGNWSVFGLWARAVLEGWIGPELPRPEYIPLLEEPSTPMDDLLPVPTDGPPMKVEKKETPVSPAPEPMEIPHAIFWSRYISQSLPEERNEVLRFLLRCQLGQRPIKERCTRSIPEDLSPGVRRFIVEYLDTFENPVPAPDPRTVLGGRVLRHGFLPEERIVHMAGLTGMAEALPALGRFVQMRRRFFHLRADYVTRPEEVGDLFMESLRALVRIALAEKGQGFGKGVETILSEMRDDGEPEPIWVEVYSSHRRGCSRYVRERTMEDDRFGLSKYEMAGKAMAAMEGSVEQRRALLEGWTGRYPVYSWVQRATEGPGVIHGGRLYYHGGSIVEAIDLPSGATVFRFDMGQTNSNMGAACYSSDILVSPDGEPILITQIVPLSAGNGRRWEAVYLDRDTGEVTDTFVLEVQPQRAYAPMAWPQRDGGVVFSQEGQVWRQKRDGDLAWKHSTDGPVTVRCHEDRVALLTKENLTVYDSSSFEPVAERPVTDYHEELGDWDDRKELREDMVLTEAGIYLFPRWEGPILACGREGKVRRRIKPENGGYWLEDPKPWRRGLCGVIDDRFCWMTEGGTMHSFERPVGTRDRYLVNDSGVFLHTDHSVFYRPFGSEDSFTAIPDIPHISEMIAVSEEHLVVNFFDDERYLACMPADGWTGKEELTEDG